MHRQMRERRPAGVLGEAVDGLEDAWLVRCYALVSKGHRGLDKNEEVVVVVEKKPNGPDRFKSRSGSSALVRIGRLQLSFVAIY